MELKLAVKKKENLKGRITNFMKKTVKDAGAKGGIVGLSGGIDSALVAVIAREALGESLHALIMPEIGVSTRKDIEDAKVLAEEFDISYEIVKINPILETLENSLSPGNGDITLARVNLRPRVRMTLLYYYANMNNYLVLGTGNKTELYMGYFTKYGDSGVDILPLGGLYKTQVKQLAEHAGIPKSIIEKPPSAGLWRGQTDEDEIGCSYEEIDVFLYSYLEEGLGLSDITKKHGFSKELLDKLVDRINISEHKRKMPKILEI